MIRTTTSWLAVTLILGTVAATGCTSTSSGDKGGSDCGLAFVHRDPIGVEQLSQDIQAGLKKGAAETKSKLRTVEANGLESLGDNLRALAAKHCYAAIGTAYPDTDEIVAKVAKDFPDQHFFTIQGGSKADNITNYTDQAEQVSYVAGAMAAKATRTKKVGVLLGMPLPPVNRWKNGFREGVASVDPKVRVFVNFVGSFTDPAKSATVAIGQAGRGADLVYAASGSDLEVARQAAKHDYSVIITNPSEYEQTSKRHDRLAFAAVQDMGAIALAAVKDVTSEHPAKGTQYFGFEQDVFAVTGLTAKKVPGSKPLADEVLEAGRKAHDDLLSGKVTIKDPTR